MSTIERRLALVEAKAAKLKPPRSEEVSEGERAVLDAIGVADWSDLSYDDLERIGQLAKEAPDFAHPLIIKACVARPEDREPDPPCPLSAFPRRPDNVPWEDPRVEPPADTPEWHAWKLWDRRYWGFLKAEDDPEAAAIAERIRAWAASPDRPYVRGADLSLLFARLGVDWPRMSYLELRRLADLCTALDEITLEQGAFDAPPAVFWCVLGWGDGHPRRRAA
jgi:hypothetical protein